MLKRKRNAAIIESDSESDTDNDENSDYETEVKLKNSLIKKPKKDSKIKSNAEKPKAKKTSSRVGLKSIDANAINDSSERDIKDGSTTSKRIKKELTKKTSTEKLKAKLNKSTTKAADDEDNKEVPVIADKANQKGNGLDDSLYDTDPGWVPADVISRELGLDWGVADTTVQLLEAGNSLPFLARYRREATGGMGPDTLRQVKESLDTLKTVKEKAEKLMVNVEKLGKMTPNVRVSILKCQSLPEIEAVSAPYKTGSKTSLAERARQLGLEPAAETVLLGDKQLDPQKFVEKGVKGKESAEEVMTGVQHVIADIIVHDPEIAEVIRNLQAECHLVLECKRAKEKASEKNKVKEGDKRDVDPTKFQNYFEFSRPCKHVQPHQVLAINRGESLKVLSVKVVVPDWLLHQIRKHVTKKWLRSGAFSEARARLVEASLEDAYKRLITPLVQRQTRAALTREAEAASITVFLSNLRALLLVPPHRDSAVLAIDPGFSHGCKLAALSPAGAVLDTAVIYPNFRNTKHQEASPAGRKIAELVKKHSISTIAIGNGTACRETEALVSDIISGGGVAGVQYTIVSEQGASIYSCSKLAGQEFPGLDTNLVSAVSIGRRLQDPLSELVKIEPQHLGVGMYQHDLAPARLNSALDEVVSECVSFVGVDVNSCSEHLLRKVAGLNTSRAKAIVEHRDKNGDFLNREQLKKVKGIGEKVWTQCAGFIRIVPRTGSSSKTKPSQNLLDRTQIHPESYNCAKKVISLAGADLGQLGEARFSRKMAQFAGGQDTETLAARLGVGPPTLAMILEALQQTLGYDYRAEFSAPLFKSGLTRAENVKTGDILTGRVNNVTHFGAFVDIGIGINGLVHVSKFRGMCSCLRSWISFIIYLIILLFLSFRKQCRVG